MSGPDFVCIGAQKAGTTWLYDNLVHHPGVWMPPVKEIHFFNMIAPHRELLGVETDKHPRGLRRYGPLLEQPSLARARWLYHFFHEHKSIAWYQRLFADCPVGRLAGDITPAYSTLDERGVEFARKLLKPECRVLLILRNPIERIWSGIKMSFRAQQRDITKADLEQLRERILSPVHRIRSDYVSMMTLWMAAFGDHFRPFLYDDLVADPRAFLLSVQSYLQLPQHVDERTLMALSNVDARKLAMPEPVRELLEQYYRPQIELLEQWIPGVSARWAS